MLVRTMVSAIVWALIVSVVLAGFSLAQTMCSYCLSSMLSWFVSFLLMTIVSLIVSMKQDRLLSAIFWTAIFIIAISVFSLLTDILVSNYRGVGVRYEFHMYGVILVCIAAYVGCFFGRLILIFKKVR